MDKFFIQNAFKTLDEIEEEMKQGKEPLRENIEKPLKEDLDIDELADKYCGQIFDLGDEPVQIVRLVEFAGSFENSIWEVIHLDGKYDEVSGADLKPHSYKSVLAEKLPKDLSLAYQRAANGFPKMKRNSGETEVEANGKKANYFPTKMRRRFVTTDFENSNYTDITSEDRKKIIKDYKDDKYKLRLIFKLYGGGYAVIFWDKNGDFVTSPRNLPTVVPESSPLHGISGVAAHSFNKLIEAADKIYVTDEDEHTIDISKINANTDTPEVTEIDKLKNKAIDIVTDRYLAYGSPERNIVNSGYRYIQNVRDNIYASDTGDHDVDSDWGSIPYQKKQLHKYQDKYNKAKIDAEKSEEYSDEILKTALARLQNAQFEYDKLHRHDKEKRNTNINYDLVRFKLLTLIKKNIADKYKSAEEDASDKFNDNRYIKALKIEKVLNEKIAKLKKELLSVTNELKALGPDLSDEAKQEYIAERDNYLDELFDDATAYLDELDKYTDKIKEYKNKKEVKESLDNCTLRIYTRSLDGSEDFIDDFDGEKEAKLKYNELVSSNMYDQVCLVSICGDNTEILLDSQENINENLDEKIDDKRSIGEIVDDKLKNEDLDKDKLTESKSFNLKDENDIIDANVYKKVGDESQDELVVVDPTIASKDEDYQPHVGDAILQCKSCKTSIFKNVNDLVKDPNSDVYNIDMDCPHCGAKNGFIYIGQVAVKNAKDDVEDEKPEENNADEEYVDIDAEEPEVQNKEESLPPVDDDYVDIGELDGVKEESFEKLVNPYLTKLYENVDSFKTTNVEQIGRDSIKIEGKLISKSGKEKLVEFLFKTKENKADSIGFQGYNKLLTEQENAFTLKGNVSNKELIFESFEYNYNKEIDGKQVLIEGIEK